MVALASTMPKLDLGIIRQTAMANTISPMLPSDDPTASMPAAVRPRSEPLAPIRFIFSFSRLSISVAVAGNMAGKARNRPPITGPNCFATMPANAVTAPPKTKRTRYWYQCDWVSPEVSILIFTGQTPAPHSTVRKHKRTTTASPGWLRAEPVNVDESATGLQRTRRKRRLQPQIPST